MNVCWLFCSFMTVNNKELKKHIFGLYSDKECLVSPPLIKKNNKIKNMNKKKNNLSGPKLLWNTMSLLYSCRSRTRLCCNPDFPNDYPIALFGCDQYPQTGGGRAIVFI